VQSIDKNGTRRIQVEASEFKGKEFLDIREYYLNDDGEWRPTKRGVTIPPASVADFAQAVLEEAGAKWPGA
jgi:hypothetical protein